MALFPIKDKGESDYLYNENEYMSIYPYITYFNGTGKYTSGKPIEKGYYVREEQESDPATITPLSEWLQREEEVFRWEVQQDNSTKCMLITKKGLKSQYKILQN